MADPEWIDEVLETINQMRVFHQVDELEWSDECYQAAKKQAEKCSESSKLVGGNPAGRAGLHGQNLYVFEDGSDVDVDTACQEWYEKSADYDFFKPTAVEDTGDFTQLVWKETRQVGMAVSDDGKYAVANFFPAGNIDGAYATNVLLPVFEVDEDVETIGMQFSSYPPNPLVVRRVNEGTWAETVDISSGDRFYSINDKPVAQMSTDEFKQIMQTRPLQLVLFMGVDSSEKNTKQEKQEEETQPPNEKPEEAQPLSRKGSVGRGKSELVADKDVDKIGMILSMPPKALEVRKVTPGGWADSKGIEPGDIFMEVNGMRISDLNPEQFMQAMKNRPIRFKLATDEEQKAAVSIQKKFRGNVARNEVSEWRMARSRKAQTELQGTKEDLTLTGQSREELIQAVFTACDSDGDGRLKKTEMLRFVRHIDFPGSDEDWDVEYGELCNEYKWGKAVGLSYEDFRDLVEDENGNPYYCGNDRLDGMLAGLERTDAAIKIQKVQRGRAARKIEDDKSKEAKKKEQEEAARKIQSIERGRVARQEVKKKKGNKAGDEEEQAKKVRIKQAREEAKQKQEEEEQKQAALKIQSIRRGHIARKETKKMQEEKQKAEEMQDREAAAKKIQKSRRSHLAKKAQNRAAREAQKQKVEQERLENLMGEDAAKRHAAAKRIQQEVRTKKERAKIGKQMAMNDEDAARKIQACERGRMQRKDMLKRKQAFTKLDEDCDGYLNELEMKNFACFLGYNGSDSEWRQEYGALCYQFRWDPQVGLSVKDFIWLTQNPDEQYWFDARLLDQGWEVAAGTPADTFGDTLYPSGQTPGTQRTASGAEIASVLRNELQRSSVEVPLVAEVTGLDWDKLLSNEDLKEKLQQNISRILNEKTGINGADLKVTLSSASRAMPGRA